MDWDGKAAERIVEILVKEIRGLRQPEWQIRIFKNWIEENQYILVTENRSTMPKHLSNHFTSRKHIPGILWVRPGLGLA
jgi:hypothetical protein